MRFEKKLKLFFRNLVLYLPPLVMIGLTLFSSQSLPTILNDFGASILPNSLYNVILQLLSYIGYDVSNITSTTFEIFLVGFVFWYILVHLLFIVIDLFTLPLHWVRLLFEKSEVNV